MADSNVGVLWVVVMERDFFSVGKGGGRGWRTWVERWRDGKEGDFVGYQKLVWRLCEEQNDDVSINHS